MNAAVEFDRVSVRFGTAVALDGVSLRIEAGRLCALCGPNGAGKSTSIRLICGLQRPSSGRGAVLGEALDAQPVHRRAQIGYMAQHTVLYDELSVAENLQFRAGVMGLDRAHTRAAQALDQHRLHAVARQRVGVLSGGWRQRVAFAVALLAAPRLLLLDEPTAGLDVAARAELWRTLREQVAQGLTAIVSSHDPAEAALCDQLILLDRGQLRFQGSPALHWNASELDALRTAAAIGMRVPEPRAVPRGPSPAAHA